MAIDKTKAVYLGWFSGVKNISQLKIIKALPSSGYQAVVFCTEWFERLSKEDKQVVLEIIDAFFKKLNSNIINKAQETDSATSVGKLGDWWSNYEDYQAWSITCPQFCTANVPNMVGMHVAVATAYAIASKYYLDRFKSQPTQESNKTEKFFFNLISTNDKRLDKLKSSLN